MKGGLSTELFLSSGAHYSHLQSGLGSITVTSSGIPHRALLVFLNPAHAFENNFFIKFSNEHVFCFFSFFFFLLRHWWSDKLFAFHSPLCPKAKCPRPGHCEEGGMSQEAHTSADTHSPKRNISSIYWNPLVSHLPSCWIPARQRRKKTQLKKDISYTFWRKGRDGGSKGCAVSKFSRMWSLAIAIQAPTLSGCVLIIFNQSGQSKVSNLAY